MRALIASFALLCACESAPGTTAQMSLSADTTQSGHFFDAPYPSDLRLDANHHPLLAAWPNPDSLPNVQGLIASASTRTYWPTLAVAYFDFTAPLASRALTDAVPADVTSPVLLVDLSSTPPARGRLTPVWLQSNVGDAYLPATTLAVAARPGFVLEPGRQYAFVVKRALNDAKGHALGVAEDMQALASGGAPSGSNGAAAQALYAPLWPALAELGVDKRDVAAATVFSTGDVVAETKAITDLALAANTVTIDGLALATDGDKDRYCELEGTITYPQFQSGMPPFDTGGELVLDANGAPVKQRTEKANVIISIPKQPMPQSGYPTVQFFHGSGGDAYDLIDPSSTEDGVPEGEGPAYVLAPAGFAAVASDLPISPSRVPGATDYAYINPGNLAATRDIFRQGVIEQRLLTAALGQLVIPASALGTCTGATLPSGVTSYKIDTNNLVAQGQSMGGMYTNLITAVEPKMKAAVPTGAGGYWAYFILETKFVPDAPDLLSALFDTHAAAISFVHPVLSLFELATEPSDPIVSTPRLAYRPLDGSPVRSVYEPVGYDDEYFPTTIYDAMALGFDHVEAGTEVWPTMQAALALDHRDGLVGYPVANDRMSLDGTPFTGAVVQYMGDGIADPHYIYTSLDAVKFQYRCFFASVIAGKPSIPAPGANADSACP